LLVFCNILNFHTTPPASNITLTRRRNVLTLFQRYAESQMAQGSSPKGLEQAFAASLEISPSLWSQIKSSRPIGDKLARQIEKHAEQATHWLDQEHDTPPLPDTGEQCFLNLAQQVWRQSNAKGKKQLIAALKLFNTN
jgi:hypothetical protein